MGSYCIRVNITGDYPNQNYTGTVYLAYNIVKMSIENNNLVTIDVNDSSLVYTGYNLSPSIAIKRNGKTYVDGSFVWQNNIDISSDFNFTYNTTHANAGSHEVVISAKDGTNFSGSVTKTFIIKQCQYFYKKHTIFVLILLTFCLL